MLSWLLVLGASLLCECSGVSVQLSLSEDTNAILHNPDMGWVLYENYPFDRSPHGSSTMLVLPSETFPQADAVALMFEWRDVEISPGIYDFSNVDRAYDYWAARGKEIQLRMSSEPLLVGPNGDAGTPQYVLDRTAISEKQTRFVEHAPYTVLDARNKFFRERLSLFLNAVHRHFDNSTRPVTLIDLRGFGLWGEWHSGFQDPDLKTRRAALKGILDLWTASLPDHMLALSFSYDPDGPKSLYAGSNKRFEALSTTNYTDFLRYSAFDLALKYKTITFRRDGCGGAVHSNERRLDEEAFHKFHKTSLFAEFLGGYGSVKQGGSNWVRWMLSDALSLHPNYLNFIGWQSEDALAFIRERPDLIRIGAVEMGYRFVPIQVTFPADITAGKEFEIESTWVNRSVGRALRDYELRFALVSTDGAVFAANQSQQIPTSSWLKGESYRLTNRVNFPGAPAGVYQLALSMRDPKTGRPIQLPLSRKLTNGFYPIATIRVQQRSPPSKGFSGENQTSMLCPCNLSIELVVCGDARWADCPRCCRGLR